jgi:hypothetical protein
MGISSKLENSDSLMIQLPSSSGLIFEASDQLDQSSFWFSLVQLILSKFLSNFKVRWSRSLEPLKLLMQFGAAWTNPLHKSFRCSLYFRQLILSKGVFNRSGVLTSTWGGSIRSGWVRSIYCLYILCVCSGGIVWRVYVWGQVCATGIYDNLLGFGLTCVLSDLTLGKPLQ